MIKIGLIGTQSMHAWAFAQVCNCPDGEGNFRIPGTRVTAAFGVDDTPEHLQMTLEKGNIPVSVSSLEEMFDHCNAFMILQRNGGEHMKYAEEVIKKGAQYHHHARRRKRRYRIPDSLRNQYPC